MAVNTELFQKIHEQFQREPETHYQGDWVWRRLGLADSTGYCGTTRCVAGWANFFSGYDEETNRDEIGSDAYILQAADQLGLDLEDAEILFHCMNKGAVADAVAMYANGADGLDAINDEDVW